VGPKTTGQQCLQDGQKRAYNNLRSRWTVGIKMLQTAILNGVKMHCLGDITTNEEESTLVPTTFKPSVLTTAYAGNCRSNICMMTE